MIIFNEPVVFVDIETTGMSYTNSRILEVAAVRVENDQVVDEFQTLINPGTPVPYYITSLTGITSADVEQQPYFEDVAQKLRDVMSGAVFAAHNVRFDLSFTKRQLEACNGIAFNPKLFCTVRLSHALYPNVKGHSLAKLIERHNLAVSARHRAYDDARVLWDFCKVAHAEHGSEAFAAAVSKQIRSRTLPPHLDSAQVETLQNEPGVYIFEDAAGQPVYVGKSIKVKQRIMSHFASSTKCTKEMKISQATHGLRVIKTAGEMEALLLESQLVKELLPLYNQQLRRVRQHVILQRNVDQQGYTHIALVTVNLAELDDLSNVYGVYSSRMKAKDALLRHRETFGLCPRYLSLEKGKGACFQYQLGRCRGACVGREAPEEYNERVELALERSKIDNWPYSSAVVIKEKTAAAQPKTGLLVDQWCVIGKVHYGDKGTTRIEQMKKLFDIDTYKILRSFIMKKPEKLEIEPFLAL